jgi:hypothetical protein
MGFDVKKWHIYTQTDSYLQVSNDKVSFKAPYAQNAQHAALAPQRASIGK